MINKIFSFIILFLICQYTFSQDVILHEFVTEKKEKPKVGPNCRYFNHFYFSIGVNAATKNNEAGIKTFSSGCSSFGNRSILRINKYMAAGISIELNNSKFNILQTVTKNVHDSILHKKEIFYLNDIGSCAFLRLNFNRRRGIYTGNFVDIGLYGNLNFRKQRFIEDNTDSGTILKIWYKNISYIENLNYGLQFRLGFNRYVLFGKYRLSDIFKPEKDFSQLPAFSAGIEIGFHK